MLIPSMKSEAVKGATAALISLLAGFIGYLLAGNFVATILEFKMVTKESYFAIPEPMKAGLQLQLQGKTISNVSVIDVGIFNRNRDLGITTVYFRLTPKKDRLPQLISAEMVPPDNLPRVGIERLPTNDPTLVGFRFATLKRQAGNEYYLAKLIFEGDEAPSAQVLTNEKDLEIVPYREWRDWLVVGFWVTFVYTIVILVLVNWESKRSAKRREQLAKEFEAQLMQQHLHSENQPLIAVADAVATYKDCIQPKPGFFSKKKPTAPPGVNPEQA